jgi:hypothetical protein
MYVHCSDVYVNVYTSIRVLTHINMYISCTNMYIHVCFIFFIYIQVKVCTADVPCTNGYTHFMKCSDIIELCPYIDVSF